MEIRLLAVCVHTSGSSSGPIVSGTPIHCTKSTTGRKRPSGSHASQSRNGSAIFAAAKKTNASTVQLKIVPK